MYVSQKLSEQRVVWHTYCKNKAMQCFCFTWYIYWYKWTRLAALFRWTDGRRGSAS